MKWVKFASDFPCEANAYRATLKQLNEDLNQRAVLLGDGLKPSEADIIVFSAVHSILVSRLFLPSSLGWTFIFILFSCAF